MTAAEIPTDTDALRAMLDDPEVRTRPPVLDERGRWHAALAADPIRETG